jgi:hypothetical protein
MPATDMNRRAHERFYLPPMYTTVTARSRRSGNRRLLQGHVYDISEGGVRIELDEPLIPGERITIDLALPGATSGVMVRGSVVWVNDDEDDPGPRRMAVRFERFRGLADRERLASYLASNPARRAA